MVDNDDEVGWKVTAKWKWSQRKRFSLKKKKKGRNIMDVGVGS